MTTTSSGTVICLTDERIPAAESRETIVSKERIGDTSQRIAIASLYGDYYDKIVRYIFIRISNRSEAENLGGEVFLRALRSLGSYRGSKLQMPAWLFSIARNLVIDYQRKMSKRKHVSIDEVEIADSHSVEQEMETKSEVARLSKALKQVTPAQREVIGLRFFAGMSSFEVSKILGKSSGAVREMQRAAIETLRKQMAQA
jgi:RNA polymerase sigma-70 factor (ECF subfamily)